jgi:hypothetical protein
MVGDAVRDKDAVAATLICEVQAKAKSTSLQRIIAIVCRTWIL